MPQFDVNQLVQVVKPGGEDDGAIGIVSRGSDDALSRVFLIRGPYWKADDPLMVRLHTRRTGIYVPTRCLRASDARLTAAERTNLIEWWDAHGFDPAQVR